MKGIIYKIVCNETGEVYYGSTQRSLNNRMIGHKASCKRWKEGKTNYITSFNIIDRGNYSYSLIETVECDEKKQLEARERFYIENNECINKTIPCRTVKEYQEAYYELHKEHKKAYRKANKEAIREYKREYDELHKDTKSQRQRIRRAKAKELKQKELINNN
jgi:hypothetical protein